MHYTCFYVVYGGLVIRLDPEIQAAGLKHSTHSLTDPTKEYTIIFFWNLIREKCYLIVILMFTSLIMIMDTCFNIWGPVLHLLLLIHNTKKHLQNQRQTERAD